MNLTELKKIRREADVTIKAAEQWAPEFRKDKKLFKKLVKVQSSLEENLNKYFKGLASRAHKYVDWRVYQLDLAKKPAIKADEYNFNVDLNFGEDEADTEASFLKINITQAMIDGVALGGLYGELDTGVKIGVSSATAWVQQTARDKIANLVTGINDTTRSKIEQSILSSLDMGESVSQATERLMGIMDDSYRAEMIARTETVGAWGNGILEFGKQVGATTKSWNTSGDPCPICIGNEADGEIDLHDSFSSGDDAPPAHPNCQCFMTLGGLGDSGTEVDDTVE